MRRFSCCLVFAFALIPLVGCGGPPDDPDMKTMTSGLKYKDVEEGKGAEAKKGDVVVVHYTGKLRNGKEFDSSHNSGKPFIFKLGAGKVIKGWDEGLVGMKVGGHRKLIIPAELGYGERGAGKDIPPNAELRFDVELVDIIGADSPKKEKKEKD